MQIAAQPGHGDTGDQGSNNGVQRENPPHHHIRGYHRGTQHKAGIQRTERRQSETQQNTGQHRRSQCTRDIIHQPGKNTGHAAQKHQPGGKNKHADGFIDGHAGQTGYQQRDPRRGPGGQHRHFIPERQPDRCHPHPDPQHHQPAAGLCGIKPRHIQRLQNNRH